jgi:predicted nuclease of predicted toxin-antitoxin system
VKLLADLGVSMTTVRDLRTAGHEVLHLREQALHRLPDPQILDKARAEGRVVLTFDLDFGDLLAAGGESGPSVIICRLSNETPASVTPRVAQVLIECVGDLERGAVVVVEDTRYRVRRLPIVIGS